MLHRVKMMSLQELINKLKIKIKIRIRIRIKQSINGPKNLKTDLISKLISNLER